MASSTPFPTLQPVFVQHLLLEPQPQPGGRAHLSAASGLVRRGRRLVVVADGALQLGLFEEAADSASPAPGGSVMPLLEEGQPKVKGLGKSGPPKAQPTLATLTLLPPMPACPAGALLALGSGAQPHAKTGVLAVLDVQGAPNGRMARVDLSALYAPLLKKFVDLNIAGALVASGELLLLQRGKQGGARSACIRYDWNRISPWLAGLQPQPPAAKTVQLMQLGSMNGVPLSLADGAALQGGYWMFCAVAVRTDSAGKNGDCVGSAIGIVSPDGSVGPVYALEGAPKVEGIAVQTEGSDWLVSLVTDAGDPALPAQLLRLRLAQ
ncbi:MAG: hypothetical protein KJ852_08640 [Gammaproteobacteria bacterium]|nr:hypothetical protein [Gammaproteobacteria bacterium]MBU0785556.1 hypothetical protein [Gammaproteobacteria bacterium]MBU0816844.1 hypothetical protein [Gammaproteobacteria bacterium]MBU1787008.1 hypothetical protein [Gammaproteobacteria bacterium]